MPVRGWRRGRSISERYAHTRKAWAGRVVKARDLRDGCADWRAVNDMSPHYRRQPAGRPFRFWVKRTGVKLTANDQLFLGVLISAIAAGHRGVWMSAEDFARRLNCSVRTIYNITTRLEALDLLRVVAQFDEVDPYKGRETVRGGGSSGKHYKRRQVPNAITLGEVGRALFTPATVSSKMRAALAKAVDKLGVASHSLTRQSLPGNGYRSYQLNLLANAHAVNKRFRSANEKPRAPDKPPPLGTIPHLTLVKEKGVGAEAPKHP